MQCVPKVDLGNEITAPTGIISVAIARIANDPVRSAP
jgi:hypothetical protein